MSAPELATLHEGWLEVAGVWALVGDLEAAAEVLDVLCKGAATARADPRAVPLRAAIDDLLAGTVRGVQVRYLYQGVEWRDTLMAGPGGVRVVRMQMPTSER